MWASSSVAISTPSPPGGVCSCGWYGTASTTTSEAACILCEIGHYCPCGQGNVAEPIDCEADHVCPRTGMSVGDPCPSYSGTQGVVGGVGIGTSCSCDSGYYHGGSNFYCTRCPWGSVTAGVGSIGPGACICPAGMYLYHGSGSSPVCVGCPLHDAGISDSAAGSTSFTDCLCVDGYYLTGTEASPECVVCPLGSYCTGNVIRSCVDDFGPEFATYVEGAETCRCNASYYNAGTISERDCRPCPSGHVCGSEVAIACPEHTTVPSGGETGLGVDDGCTLCLKGFYCVGQNGMTPCPHTTTTLGPGAGGVEECVCMDGYEASGGVDVACVPCGVGRYCVNGSVFECGGAKNHTAGAGSSNASACICPPLQPLWDGVRCLSSWQDGCLGTGATRWNGTSASTECGCTAGTFGGGEDSNFTCVVCPAGSYCPWGSETPVLCGAGSLSAAGSVSVEDCVGQVETGGGVDRGDVTVGLWFPLALAGTVSERTGLVEIVFWVVGNVSEVDQALLGYRWTGNVLFSASGTRQLLFNANETRQLLYNASGTRQLLSDDDVAGWQLQVFFDLRAGDTFARVSVDIESGLRERLSQVLNISVLDGVGVYVTHTPRDEVAARGGESDDEWTIVSWSFTVTWIHVLLAVGGALAVVLGYLLWVYLHENGWLGMKDVAHPQPMDGGEDDNERHSSSRRRRTFQTAGGARWSPQRVPLLQNRSSVGGRWAPREDEWIK